MLRFYNYNTKYNRILTLSEQIFPKQRPFEEKLNLEK